MHVGNKVVIITGETRWGLKCRQDTGGRIEETKAERYKNQRQRSSKSRVQINENTQGTKNRKIPTGRHWWETSREQTDKHMREKNDYIQTLMRGWGTGGVRREKDRWGNGMGKHWKEGKTHKGRNWKGRWEHNFAIKQEIQEHKNRDHDDKTVKTLFWTLTNMYPTFHKTTTYLTTL